ncbi:MAG: type II toxin-antitoxin system VapB family antitoxin [Oscillospiraceae bacterium]|nr:type II toxin-antitoxin system VapB family antitoxin [Oscillospiraceae bacterium]
MRTNIVIDDSLMQKAMSVSQSKTKKEVIEKALLEFIAANTRRDLLDLQGNILFADDYDYKALREGR